MDINVNVKVSLSAETLLLLATMRGETSQETKAETTPTVQADKTEKTPAKSGGAGKESKTKEEPAKEVRNFEDFSDDEKIEAIKAEVTKHTKRGKSADIKALLTFVGVARVSELQGEDIDTFMSLVQRYGKGEDIDALTSLD